MGIVHGQKESSIQYDTGNYVVMELRPCRRGSVVATRTIGVDEDGSRV